MFSVEGSASAQLGAAFDQCDQTIHELSTSLLIARAERDWWKQHGDSLAAALLMERAAALHRSARITALEEILGTLDQSTSQVRPPAYLLFPV